MQGLRPGEAMPILSIVVIFHNMRREAERTLYSLSADYQEGVLGSEYEVIAVDSNSQEPLDETRVLSFGPQFRYLNVTWEHPAPSRAINVGIAQSRAENIMCIIDGARILSPGIVTNTLRVLDKFDNPFVYTLGMHLGPKVQNESMLEGYNQEFEDDLLKRTPWRENGYSLFSVSSVALSSKKGFYSEIVESNCFSLRKDSYNAIGGMDERFISPGGGLVNLDFFERATKDENITPVMLLGEATFHQYHGGVATNVLMKEHPLQTFLAEYMHIHGKQYEPRFRCPVYFGEVAKEALHLANRDNTDQA